MIEVQDLGRSFGKVEAVRSVSFTAHDGQITGLLGPNGAGKTTTLRILYTAIAPDRGTATVDGFNSKSQAHEVQKRLGVVPDAHGLYPRLTSREHIEYFGALQGMSESEIEQATSELVERLDMADIIDRRTTGFSQGQRVKVTIARALAHRPKNIIMDEPTRGLDVTSTRAMRDFIRAMRDEGRCVLFSSHIMQEVSALCDRIIVISGGRVVTSGTPDEIRQATGKPNLEDAFVDIIGSEEGLS